MIPQCPIQVSTRIVNSSRFWLMWDHRQWTNADLKWVEGQKPSFEDWIEVIESSMTSMGFMRIRCLTEQSMFAIVLALRLRKRVEYGVTYRYPDIVEVTRSSRRQKMKAWPIRKLAT